MNRILPLAFASAALLFGIKGLSAENAGQCNTYAAGYQEDAATYFQLDTGSGQNGQPEQKVSEFAGLLNGKWRGHSSALNCIGHYSNSKAELVNYSVEAEVFHKFNGALKLEAEQTNQRSVKLTKLYLAPELKRLNAPKWRNYTVEFLSPTRVRFDHKYRARNGFADAAVPQIDLNAPERPNRALCRDRLDQPAIRCHSTRMIHEIKEIDLHDNQLTVDHQLFMNGLFVSREKWTLTRS